LREFSDGLLASCRIKDDHETFVSTCSLGEMVGNGPCLLSLLVPVLAIALVLVHGSLSVFCE
jgi:hypothetical protein